MELDDMLYGAILAKLQNLAENIRTFLFLLLHQKGNPQ